MPFSAPTPPLWPAARCRRRLAASASAPLLFPLAEEAAAIFKRGAVDIDDAAAEEEELLVVLGIVVEALAPSASAEVEARAATLLDSGGEGEGEGEAMATLSRDLKAAANLPSCGIEALRFAADLVKVGDVGVVTCCC